MGSHGHVTLKTSTTFCVSVFTKRQLAAFFGKVPFFPAILRQSISRSVSADVLLRPGGCFPCSNSANALSTKAKARSAAVASARSTRISAAGMLPTTQSSQTSDTGSLRTGCDVSARMKSRLDNQPCESRLPPPQRFMGIPTNPAVLHRRPFEPNIDTSVFSNDVLDGSDGGGVEGYGGLLLKGRQWKWCDRRSDTSWNQGTGACESTRQH